MLEKMGRRTWDILRAYDLVVRSLVFALMPQNTNLVGAMQSICLNICGLRCDPRHCQMRLSTHLGWYSPLWAVTANSFGGTELQVTFGFH